MIKRITHTIKNGSKGNSGTKFYIEGKTIELKKQVFYGSAKHVFILVFNRIFPSFIYFCNFETNTIIHLINERMTSVAFVFIFIVVAFLLLNAILYSIKIKVDNSGAAKIIAIYLWAMTSIQVLSEVLSFLTGYTLFISHIYFYSQFILIGIFYHQICEHPSQKLFIRWYFAGTTFLLLLQYFVSPEISYRFNLLEVFLTNYLLVICPLMYIYNTTPENRTFSYLNLGFLTYGISGGTIFLFGNILSFQSFYMNHLFYLIHIGTLIFLYIMQLLQWIKLFGRKLETIKS